MEIFNCPSFVGYGVNEKGDVFSFRTRTSSFGKHGGSEVIISNTVQKQLSPFESKKGYLSVTIKIDKEDKIRPVGVHVLVADAFIGKKPNGHIVRHLDDNPKNNVPSNLAYGINKDNVDDRKRNGGYAKGEEHCNSVLTYEKAEAIRLLRKQKMKVKDIALIYGVSISTIEQIIYNKRYINPK